MYTAESPIGVEIARTETTPSIGISDSAARRWDAKHGHPRFRGHPRELLERVRDHWGQREPGSNRVDLQSVVVVKLPNSGFYCDAIVGRAGHKAFATFTRRNPGEDGFGYITAKGEPEPAKYSAAVLYAKATLLENGGWRSTSADWEIVSLVTSPLAGRPPPMDPLTIARNVLEKPGGTAMPVNGRLACQFAEAVIYHSQRAALHVGSIPPSTTSLAPDPSLPLLRPSDTQLPGTTRAPSLRCANGADPILYRGDARGLLQHAQEHWPPPPNATGIVAFDVPPSAFCCRTVRLTESVPLNARFVNAPHRGVMKAAKELSACGEVEPALMARLYFCFEPDGYALTRVETSPLETPSPSKPWSLARAVLTKEEVDESDAYALAESVYHHSLRTTHRELLGYGL